MGKLANLAEKAPNHPLVQKYLEISKAPLKLAPYVESIAKTAVKSASNVAPYVGPVVKGALKLAPVVGAASTALDALEPSELATEKQEQETMKQAQETPWWNYPHVPVSSGLAGAGVLKTLQKQEEQKGLEEQQASLTTTPISPVAALSAGKTKQFTPPSAEGFNGSSTTPNLALAESNQSKTQPSIDSVSKQQAGIAPKLAGSAVDKEVQALIDQQKGSSQYYQNLMNQYNQIQKFGQDKQLMGRLGEAGEDLAYALARAKKPESSFYKDFAESGEKDIKQFKEKSEFEKKARLEDPKSEESIAARALLKQQGVNVPDTVSAAFIEKNYPQFANIIEKDRQAKQRAFDKEEQREFRLNEQASSWLNETQKEVGKTDEYKTKVLIEDARNRLQNAINNPSSISDIGSLYGFFKVLDPKSVVRESETKLGREALGFISRIKNRVLSFGPNPRTLDDKVLKDIQNLMKIIGEDADIRYNTLIIGRKQAGKLAGYSPEKVNAIDMASFKPEAVKNPKIEAAAKQAKMTYEGMERYLKDTGQLK
jgi:hypothetical protein